jgi:flagellar biosynthesis chaperone FliJ
MNRYLEELARSRTRQGKSVSKADLIREAIRHYMDNQADLNGSRRQIAKTLDGKLQIVTDSLQILTTQVQALRTEVKTHNSVIEGWKQAIQPLLNWIAERRINK